MNANSALLLAALLPFSLGLSPQNNRGTSTQAGKPVKVFVSVEAEGHSLSLQQVGDDLTTPEISDLRDAVKARVARIPNHTLVPSGDPSDYIEVLVVAEKVRRGDSSLILLSSVVGVAKADMKTDLFLSHDVIAEPTIELAANAVAGQLVGLELKTQFGG